MKRETKLLTFTIWVDLAPNSERWVPITYNGTVLYDRESGSQGFASPTDEGRRKFQALFRTMSMKAKALGYRKAAA